MNSISIDNEKYVKATDIARELGYTADYVGQLCRAKKVDAQLVGRSWYVSEDSIRAYKRTRYRSTKTADKKNITTSLDIQTKNLDAKEVYDIPVETGYQSTQSHYAQANFYKRTPKYTVPHYQEDTSDLIPLSSNIKTGRISVALADAKKVNIKSQTTEYNFDPTELPEIRFKGKLPVQDIYDQEKKESIQQDVSGDFSSIKPEPVIQKESKIQKKSIETNEHKVHVRHLRKSNTYKKRRLPLEHNDQGVIGMRKNRIVDRNPMGGTLKINVPVDIESARCTFFGMYVILVAVILSTSVFVALIGIQANVVSANGYIENTYGFALQNVMTTVFLAW